ncbi:hypothetical protein ACH5RR_021503 [Cinchona calisaya]|uniref:Phytocyanin domain-containing protein n=1 Tax=Cinchona calisaya TaxID=153742 RepID=A0ABD2ZIH7_9GENT
MAMKFNILAIVAILAATLHCSVAQRTHIVGDSLGWLVPPGGPIAYTTWASKQTFTVGDVLIFNFPTGIHNVAQVTRTSFDACNTTSPISLTTNGPANITLTTAGEHYYICTFSSHCDLGQKLAINVSAAPSTSPPPQSATPSPVPAPSPSRTPQTYIVGDNLGWLVPPGGSIAYRTWATTKTFLVGDILVFNFTRGAHDVAVVTSKAAYDSCNTSATETPITTSPARITLTSPGEHFYICTFPQHCSLGQKLAISVTGLAATPTPIPSPVPTPAPTRPPPSGPVPAPAPSSTRHTPPPSGSTTAPAPSGPTAPSPAADVSAPPAPNSAPSFAVAALPFTFLSIALAFFY